MTPLRWRFLSTHDLPFHYDENVILSFMEEIRPNSCDKLIKLCKSVDMFGISSGGLLHQQYHKEYILERLGKNQSFTTGGNSLKLPPPSKSHLGLLP